MRLRLTAFFGTPDRACEIAVVDRQRIVGERDPRDVDAGQREFVGYAAASFTLCEPIRSEPGMTRIFRRRPSNVLP